MKQILWGFEFSYFTNEFGERMKVVRRNLYTTKELAEQNIPQEIEKFKKAFSNQLMQSLDSESIKVSILDFEVQ